MSLTKFSYNFKSPNFGSMIVYSVRVLTDIEMQIFAYVCNNK